MTKLKYTDVMLDLETLGKRPGCMILTIAAVAWNRESTEFIESGLKTFFARLSLPCYDEFSGFHIDPTTLAWWGNQSTEAIRDSFAGPSVDIRNALSDFKVWLLNLQNDSIRVWGHGATFDVSILEEAYRIVKIPSPWTFRDVRDSRTIFDACGYDTRTAARGEGVKHSAMADARFQAFHVWRCQKKLAKWRRCSAKLDSRVGGEVGED